MIALTFAAFPALSIQPVDWSGTMHSPRIIPGVAPGQTISAGGWLVVADDVLRVYDTGNVIAPVLIGALPMGGSVQRFRKSDDTVYVVGRPQELLSALPALSILDLADPASPATRLVFAPSDTVTDIAFMGDLAIVVTKESESSGHLYVLADLTSGSPTVVSSTATTIGLISVAVSGHVAMAGTNMGILPIDLIDPENPVVGQLRFAFFGPWNIVSLPITDLVISGTKAYASVRYHNAAPYWSFWDRLIELDITNPMNPVGIRWVAAPVGSIALSDNLIVIAGRSADGAQLTIFDRESFNVTVRFLLYDQPTSAVLHHGSHIYIAGALHLQYLDTSTAQCVSPVATTSFAGTVIRGGRYRLVGNAGWIPDSSPDGEVYETHFRIYDMGKLAVLTELRVYSYSWYDFFPSSIMTHDRFMIHSYFSSWTYPSRFHEIRSGLEYVKIRCVPLAMVDDIVWSGHSAEITAWHLTDRWGPVELYRFTAPSNEITKHAVQDGKILVCHTKRSSGNLLWAVRLGDTYAEPLSLIEIEEPLAHVQFREGLFHILNSAGNIIVYDYTDPEAPAYLGSFDGQLVATRFTCAEGVYVLGNDDGFRVLLGEQGELPQPVAPFINCRHTSFVLHGDHLYLGDGIGNVFLYDLGDPSIPQYVGMAHGPNATLVHVDGDRLYAGYSVFPLHAPDTTPIDDPASPEEALPTLPHSAVLHAASPNPFNPRTTLSFSLGYPEDVTVTIHDLRGRRVATLLRSHVGAGDHRLGWSGTDDQGRPLPSGTYIARLVSTSAVRTTKVVLIQ